MRDAWDTPKHAPSFLPSEWTFLSISLSFLFFVWSASQTIFLNERRDARRGVFRARYYATDTNDADSQLQR